MRRCSVAILLMLALLSARHAVGDAPAATDAKPATDPAAVAALITDLGSDQYAVRRHAEDELTRIGAEAYDQLKLAEQHGDLEISERASYILQRMRVEWVRQEDAPEVRRALTRFGDLSVDDKRVRLMMLAALPEGQGLPALCRVARLERNPQVARQAALKVLAYEVPEDGKLAAAEACRQELQASDRPAVAWIEIWLREPTDRDATLPAWNDAIAAEMILLEGESPDTEYSIVQALMKRRLDLCNKLGLVEETATALDAAVALLDRDDEGSTDQLNGNIAWGLNWITENKSWQILDKFHQSHRERIHDNRQLYYMLAVAVDGAGRKEEAAKLADEAYEFDGPFDEPGDRIGAAETLAKHGHIAWAEREYRAAIDAVEVLSIESMFARQHLSSWLHDREDYKGASDVLAEFFIELSTDKAGRRALLQQLDGRAYLDPLEARQLLCLAAHQRSRQEYDLERETLEKAYDKYDDDPDILIAMYRSPGADEAYLERTRERIAKMSEAYLEEIESAPENPSKYNQWAWLISNTEGDYAQAVKHSLHSLEIAPDEPSYLDTLGRCYFAAGDLDNAIKTQQKAVELAPQYQIMRRQLAEFEKAKAAK